jgi:MtrB/PioB family decaheme-associated outer membrane protein
MSAHSAARLRLCAAIAAALAAWSSAQGAEEDEEIARLITPRSTVEAGLGYVSGDNTRFGQYTGMTDKKAYPLLDVNVRRRSADGLWLNLTGRDLGLDSRELRIEASRQGDWGVFAEFWQLPRFSPYTPLTRLTGYDTTTQTVNGQAAASPLELSTERRRLDFGASKILGGSFDVQFRVRNEEKQGRRLYGRTGSDFLVDPIDYSTQIYEATAGYTSEKLQLSGGYYGTNFQNGKTRLDVIGGTGTGFSPLALPPGNQSHQLHLAGGYAINPTTRATFKLARGVQIQEEAFIDATTTRRTNLGGRVQTTFAQAGITARPLPQLSLLGNLRYENRDDQTPVADYFTATAATTATGENEPRSLRARVAKAEGTYRLPMGFSLTGGVENENRWRNTSSVRAVSFRTETDETSYRAELRRAMSETLNGSIAYIASRRDGSPWQTTVLSNAAGTGPGTTLGSNLMHPLHLADRKRDKTRATLAWQATEQLDLNFVADYANDDYSGRTLGLRDGRNRHYAVDSAYRINDAWSVTAWFSRDDTRARLDDCASAAATNSGNLSACPNTAANPIWSASLRNLGDAFGAGVKGKPSGVLDVGADLAWSRDRGEFRQSPIPAGITAVPDSRYTRTTLKLHAKYALTKTSGVKVQFIEDRFRTDDWTWTNWVYSDGTRVLANATQRVHFIGVSAYIDF